MDDAYIDPEIKRLKVAVSDALHQVGAISPCPTHPDITVVADRAREVDACDTAVARLEAGGYCWMRPMVALAVGGRIAAAAERCPECRTPEDKPAT